MTDKCRWDLDDPRVEEASQLMLSERPDEARAIMSALLENAKDQRRLVTVKNRVDHDRVRGMLDVQTGRHRHREIARELGISERTVLRIARAL